MNQLLKTSKDLVRQLDSDDRVDPESAHRQEDYLIHEFLNLLVSQSLNLSQISEIARILLTVGEMYEKWFA